MAGGQPVADILAVGAGISGVATAFFLAEAGRRVILAETHWPAWSASGRNSGVLWMQGKLAASLAFFKAARHFAGQLASRMPDYGFPPSGGLLACRDGALVPRLRALAASRTADGLECTFLDGADARALCPALGPWIEGAVFCAADACQDTAALVGHMMRALIAKGAQIMTGRAVSWLDVRGSRCCGAVLEDGTTVAAGATVLATGPWVSALLMPHGLHFPMRTVRYEAAETAPAPFRIGPVFCGQALLHMQSEGRDPAYPSSALHPAQRLDRSLLFAEQLAQHADGRILFGSAYKIGTMDDRPTVAGQDMGAGVLAEDFPGLATLPITRCWGGIVAETADALPVLEQDGPKGLTINAGNANGNLTGAFCGALAAALVTHHKPT